jgi:hypothetical protein
MFCPPWDKMNKMILGLEFGFFFNFLLIESRMDVCIIHWIVGSSKSHGPLSY